MLSSYAIFVTLIILTPFSEIIDLEITGVQHDAGLKNGPTILKLDPCKHTVEEAGEPPCKIEHVVIFENSPCTLFLENEGVPVFKVVPISIGSFSNRAQYIYE